MTQSQPQASLPLVILVPAYNDWESLRLLLPKIDAAMAGQGPAEMLVLDDGSIDPQPGELSPSLTNLSRIRVLELRRNLGHQRAICVGLSYVSENVPCSGVVVMDADGEDDPLDLPKLIGRFHQENHRKVVFAGRARRSESAAFRLFYAAYKLAHFILTGHRVEVGNFSVLPAMQLQRLVVVSELWNHFAAAIYSARIPYVIVPTARSHRLAGRSKMNFVALVTHGLSAISVFGERVGVRVLVTLSFLSGIVFLAIATTIGIRLYSGLAIPGWATYTTGLLVIILLQVLMLASIYIVLVLGSRQGAGFLPIRDYRYFCGRLRDLDPAPQFHG